MRLSNSSIDNLGDALRDGVLGVDELRMLEAYRRTFQPIYEGVVAIARDKLKMAVTGRPSKSTGAIVEKLRRERMRLSQMQDIAGCRVVVDDVPLQQRAVMALETFLGTPQIVDRRTRPSHGYRAVHLIVRDEKRCVEIQVRTTLQHYWAEFSEKLADTFDPAIKYGLGPERLQRLLKVISEAIARLENVEADRANALRELGKVLPTLAKPARKRLNQAEKQYQGERKRMMQLMEVIRSDAEWVK